MLTVHLTRIITESWQQLSDNYTPLIIFLFNNNNNNYARLEATNGKTLL